MNAKAADFVLITVSDVGESVAFYRDTLGLALESLDEETGWAELALPPTTLALGEENPQFPTSPGDSGIALALAVDDVEEATDELRDAGRTVLMGPVETSVCDMAVVGDPDDNPLLLHRRRDGTYGRRDPIPGYDQ
ncbi:hypothetical protein C2R22_22105 (plasmid) [Salinigranum rubrum]|uniref:VOC domain-containing protein n=1 Tax=Salinigranum rubrum TaxID=755307 RepID=A0A2I8VQP6_9EURY|nr:VOC family protein [Salinigranum rubrum]AUV84250.1 hypothetical protein C2R22_22105 [Salinigranum rubrum]